MNYRHIYHAGNICDVVKHAVLSLLIDHLRQKESGFFVLDTHAGTGLYDLGDERALKTAEAAAGVLKLRDGAPLPELEPYQAALDVLNPGTATQFYPGSPMLVKTWLRPQDRLIANELHPEDFAELRRHMGRAPNIALHHRDGYEALRAFLPPKEKRGLVLIDPPFEQPDELATLITAMTDAHRRWPQGIFMLWYPVKDRPALWRFHEAMTATGMPKQLVAEFIYHEESRVDRLNGSGLLLINPPWKFDDKLREVFPALHAKLGTLFHDDQIKWLAGEI